MHPTFAPPASVAPQLRLSCALPDAPSLPKVACNSRTGVTHQHEVIQTSNILRENCMRNCRAPHCAPRKVARNSPRTSFINSSKTAEYQRSHFKTRNILKGITCEIARQNPCTPEAAAGPAGSGRASSQPSAHQAPLVWRAPEGPEGTGGLQGAAPNAVRPPSLAGGRGLRRPEHQRSHKQRPIGGRRGACGAWPGFETTRRAKLAARTASGRAGHAAAGDQAGHSNAGDQAGH